MRIAIHLSTFEKTHPCAYAIVWIDRGAQRWSRESHFGLALPASGIVHARPGVTLLCDAHERAPLCALDELEWQSESGPFEGAAGSAQWCGDTARGHWYVQCVDDEATPLEHSRLHSLLADDAGI
ncbi:DUF3564 family protein [Trinickia acidisoli]|uniref:DUF3564 family protein n=1 Tax=Trinickia acidisoli TaxID=2767482 RepID=UPI001A8E2BA0|nr:DUF3564 family protein [Trinickia acidisoli]